MVICLDIHYYIYIILVYRDCILELSTVCIIEIVTVPRIII